MKIKTKFKVGDKLYYIERSEYSYEDCNICDNTGRVIIKNKEFLCPECNGDRQKINKVCYGVKQGVVDSIFINISENKFVIRYGLDGLDLLRKDENLCFKTKAEAKAECDRRNNDNKNG